MNLATLVSQLTAAALLLVLPKIKQFPFVDLVLCLVSSKIMLWTPICALSGCNSMADSHRKLKYNILDAIDLSVRSLDEEHDKHFQSLSVFGADIGIPCKVRHAASA